MRQGAEVPRRKQSASQPVGGRHGGFWKCGRERDAVRAVGENYNTICVGRTAEGFQGTQRRDEQSADARPLAGQPGHAHDAV